MPLFRILRIAFAMMDFAIESVSERFGLGRRRLPAPERLSLILAWLGTTFIKVGQALSMRQDMLPDDYIVALQSLQDHAPPFPTDIAIAEVVRGLGHPLDELFEEFDRQPLAAASVAQVHAARLRDGRAVIVKVRRPGVRSEIDKDMRAILWLARAAMILMPRLKSYHPQRIVEEIWSNLHQETDFRREGRNIRCFVAAFAGCASVHIPDVVDGLVCESVIVQERSGGLRIDDPTLRPDGQRLAKNFVDVYLRQIFVLGVFHGDPHAGNLFITADGRICLHDFGLIGFLDRATRRKLAAFTSAFVAQDADWLLDAAIDLGVLGGAMDRSQFRRGLAEIIADYAALPFKEWSLADAFLRVTRLGRAQNVLVPLDLLILMRAMFLAEQAVRLLDPEFQLIESLRERGPEVLKTAMQLTDTSAMVERLKFDAATALHDLPLVLRTWTRQLDQEGEGLGFRLHIGELNGLNAHIDRGTNRVALGLVTLGLYIAGSLLMQHSLGPRLFGDMPVLAVFAYVLALWFTFRLARGIARSGRL